MSAGEVCQKLMVFYYFIPIVHTALEGHDLEFWFEVEDFKCSRESPARKSTKKLKKEALRILQTYLTVSFGSAVLVSELVSDYPHSQKDRPKEVNVDDDVLNEVTINVGNASHPRVFDVAQLHVLSNLAQLFKNE